MTQANLHLYHVSGPRSQLDEQLLALHCEPDEHGETERLKFKRGPHIHVCAGGNALSKAHFPLNYSHLDGALQTMDELMSVWETAIKIVQIEVLENEHVTG